MDAWGRPRGRCRRPGNARHHGWRGRFQRGRAHRRQSRKQRHGQRGGCGIHLDQHWPAVRGRRGHGHARHLGGCGGFQRWRAGRPGAGQQRHGDGARTGLQVGRPGHALHRCLGDGHGGGHRRRLAAHRMGLHRPQGRRRGHGHRARAELGVEQWRLQHLRGQRGQGHAQCRTGRARPGRQCERRGAGQQRGRCARAWHRCRRQRLGTEALRFLCRQLRQGHAAHRRRRQRAQQQRHGGRKRRQRRPGHRERGCGQWTSLHLDHRQGVVAEDR
ncbi:hypothetical protein D3C71_1190560 [compost metagenome]